MSEKQAFGILVRGIGVFLFLEGIKTFWFALWEWDIRGPALAMSSDFAIVGSNFIYGVFAVILGAILIRWPGWVVHIAWLEKLPTIGRMPDHDDHTSN